MADLVTALGELSNCAAGLDDLRSAETRAWRVATLATNDRVAATQRARFALASALEFGLKVEQALKICEKFSLLDAEDLGFMNRALAKGTLDLSRLPRFLRKSSIHASPVEQVMWQARRHDDAAK